VSRRLKQRIGTIGTLRCIGASAAMHAVCSINCQKNCQKKLVK
jgi:hypothetical protein